MYAKLNFKQVISAGLMAAFTATILNSILFYIFHGAGIIVDSIFIQPNQPMTLVPVLISSLVPTLLATLVFFLLEKYTKNGFRIFRTIALVLMALSFLNPFMGINGITMGYAIALNIMHVVVVGALLFFIGKSSKNKAEA